MNLELLILLSLGIAVIALIIQLNKKSKQITSLTSEIQQSKEEYNSTLNQKVNDYEQIINVANSQKKEEASKYESEIARCNKEISKSNFEILGLKRELETAVKLYSPIMDKDKAITERNAKIEQLNQECAALKEKYQAALQVHKNLEREIDLYNDSLEIGSFGLYKPKYSFDVPEQYKLELESIYQKQKALIVSETAAYCRTEWEVSGSKAEGKKMTRRYIKLMLSAFNGECDALIAKVKWNNAAKTEERIRSAFVAINKLGESHTIAITGEYLRLKLQELSLTYEYEVKKQEEKEEQKRIREQMREEERAQKEFERAEKEAEDEERKYQKALEKAQKELGVASKEEMEALNEKIGQLEQSLQEAKERKERAISLAQLTKVGHIYVISNIGSFGENVYKIGMTRRLDPLDRIKELGDASVPFQFDVHAIIYSENAPQLENELHKRFDDKRLNRINGKKEFFKISLDEIEAFIKKHTSAEIQFTKLAEAKEFRETVNLIEQIAKVNDPITETQKFPESLFG